MRDREKADYKPNLDTPVQYLKGVGPHSARLLGRLGIETVGDLLRLIPRRYVDRSSFKTIREARVGELATVMGEVATTGVKRTRRGDLFTLILSDGTGIVDCGWFHQSRYLKNQLKTGMQLIVSGEVSYYRGKQFLHPEYEIVSSEEDELLHTGRIVPIYPSTEGLYQKRMRKMVKSALDHCLPQVWETLPARLLRAQNLLPLGDAIRQVHFPDDLRSTMLGRNRFAFEELFYLQILLALRKKRMSSPKLGISFKSRGGLVRRLLNTLEFELTPAQKKVVKEIIQDMRNQKSMHRLLQGDVGSGKTVVALCAMLRAAENGYQATLMAPTEILAEQHYFVLKDYLRRIGMDVSLLIGGMKKKEREEVYEKIRDGSAKIVVGTHALIEEGVRFDSLGLVTVDEQHRFGVMQRAKLRRKGFSPDFLVMTATPIPRSLSMTVYGDLDISVIDELPPGRKKVTTRWTKESNREKTYQFVEEHLRNGEQCYIVYPLVEESEKMDLKAATEMYVHLRDEVFPDYGVSLLHGRMSREEKESVMMDFRSRRTQVLVTTTVIEVGVDIPQATIMVVEHAERFGLAQLHQLRGRVGRGQEKSYCILIASQDISQEAAVRLNTLQATDNGFKIAEKDLQLRGPGEFFGTRQHGLPELKVANLLEDTDLLSAARREAFAIVDEDPNLLKSENKMIRKNLVTQYKGKLALGETG